MTNLDAYRFALEERIKALRERICAGNCHSYEAYRELVGNLRGLETALGLTLPPEEKKREST